MNNFKFHIHKVKNYINIGKYFKVSGILNLHNYNVSKESIQ